MALTKLLGVLYWLILDELHQLSIPPVFPLPFNKEAPRKKVYIFFTFKYQQMSVHRGVLSRWAQTDMGVRFNQQTERVVHTPPRYKLISKYATPPPSLRVINLGKALFSLCHKN